MKSPTWRHAASMSGEPGQFVASPQPTSPLSASIFRNVQLYLMPSTRNVWVERIFMTEETRASVEDAPTRIDESPAQGADEEEAAHHEQRGVPVAEPREEKRHEQRAEHTADLTGGVHR